MTHLAVSILVHDRADALRQAAMAAEHGADLVEFRIDGFSGSDEEVGQLIDASPIPCILTCRHEDEGGREDMTPARRIERLLAGLKAGQGPAYVDVELTQWQAQAELREALMPWLDHPGNPGRRQTGLILSTHDFVGRPADLYQRIEAMAASPAARVIKVAWRARSLYDNLEAFELIGQQFKPTIAICMGDHGLPSRVLARKFNALLTFASPPGHQAAAPGQPDVVELKNLYRWDDQHADTEVYGVIGHPVGHSMSPAIHNAGFSEIGHNGVYVLMPVQPEWESFKAVVRSWLDLPSLNFRGASVTIPHKENLLRFVGEQGGHVEPLAELIGAANTLSIREDGGLMASNSDYAAALDALCAALGIEREGLAGRRVVVLGAGGAARAIVAGLAQYGATVIIYNRTQARAEELAAAFSSLPGKVVAGPWEKRCQSCCPIVINCTPLGMHPKEEDTPWPTEEMPDSFGDDAVVFDTIYNPLKTRLIRDAQARGCRIITGDEMFIRQAATQFELWTGKAAPLERFAQVMRRKLEGK
ncbi:MAG: shikimate dehydrogenase [Phycisphaeraceae bacterium]|nr:shikimate dehydrogenase [Phycisphaeraceae bacterium]